MKMHDFITVSNLEEAVKECKKEKRILFSGGTNLMVKGRGQHSYQEETMVDIHRITELNYIEETQHTVEIGATVTLTQLVESDLIQKQIPVLAKAAESVANCQIRNLATIGGNVANACPASDCIPVLMILGANVKIQGLSGVRMVPIEELFLETKACLRHEGMQVRTCFFKETTTKRLKLERGEVITSFSISKNAICKKQLFYKLSENESSGLGIMNIAMQGNLNEDGKIESVQISMGGLFAKPRTFEGLSHIIRSKKPDTALFEMYAAEAGTILEQESPTLSSIEYKKIVMRHLISDGLAQIFLDRPMNM